jgi:hypothetical protein
MPHRIRVAIVIKETTMIINVLAQVGKLEVDEEEDWQFDAPDNETTVFPFVTAADRNTPWANTCGDGSGVG